VGDRDLYVLITLYGIFYDSIGTILLQENVCFTEPLGLMTSCADSLLVMSMIQPLTVLSGLGLMLLQYVYFLLDLA